MRVTVSENMQTHETVKLRFGTDDRKRNPVPPLPTCHVFTKFLESMLACASGNRNGLCVVNLSV